MEFADRRASRDKFRRVIFSRPVYEDGQRLLEFARPDQILYTNLGRGERIDELLRSRGLEHRLTPESVLESYHGRGADELAHRALKDFASEILPFRRFQSNAAFYYVMLVAFFLKECFKQDVCDGVAAATAYAGTLRRRVIDVAGKIVRHAGRVVLKVAAATFRQLQLDRLWKRSADPPRFRWT